MIIERIDLKMYRFVNFYAVFFSPGFLFTWVLFRVKVGQIQQKRFFRQFQAPRVWNFRLCKLWQRKIKMTWNEEKIKIKMTTTIIIITGARTAPAENMYHVSWLYASEKSPPYIRNFFFFFLWSINPFVFVILGLNNYQINEKSVYWYNI